MTSKIWFIIVTIAFILLILFVPIWCQTIYLSGINETVVEQASCGSIIDLLKGY